jgi:hypothetical protein
MTARHLWNCGSVIPITEDRPRLPQSGLQASVFDGSGSSDAQRARTCLETNDGLLAGGACLASDC